MLDNDPYFTLKVEIFQIFVLLALMGVTLFFVGFNYVSDFKDNLTLGTNGTVALFLFLAWSYKVYQMINYKKNPLVESANALRWY